MATTLTPIITGTPGYPPSYNVGMAETFSWIPIENDANRPLFARAGYITNLKDLSISLSASDINIGGVELVDGEDHNVRVKIAQLGTGKGNALQVVEMNPLTSVRILNTTAVSGSVTILNPVSSVSLVNQLTGISIINDVQVHTTNTVDVSGSVTILNPVSSVSLVNQLTAITVSNPVTAVTVLNPVSSVSLTNQLTSISINNDVQVHASSTFPVSGSITVTNPVTGVQILNTAAVSGSVTVLNPVSSVSLTNQLTSVSVTNDVQVHASATFPVSGSVTVTNPVTAINVTVVNPASAATLVTFADTPQVDQTGRLRVSTPQTQWWYSASVDKDGDLRYIESLTDGASSIFVQNLASVNMTSGTTSVSGHAIRVSRRRHKIIPGLSHTWNGTVNFDGKQDNVIKRIGIYTQYNGYFFELSGSDMNVCVRRRLTDGTLVEERVNQNNWNSDKLNGSGPSGENWSALTQTATITGWTSTTPLSVGATVVYNVVYNLSAGSVGAFRQGTKATITNVTPAGYNATALIANTDTTTNRLTATYLFNPGVSASNASAGSMYQTGWHMQHSYWIDFIGGRTNKVRFGKESDNGPIILHQYKFDGLLGTAYENAPALTERKEIINIGSVTSIPSMTVMGNSFNIEAAVDLNPNFGTAYNNAGIAFTTPGQEYPVLGVAIRAGEPYQRSDIQIQNISIIDTANAGTGGGGANATVAGVFFWRLLLNPTLSGVPSSTNVGKTTRQWAYTTGSGLSGGNGSQGIELMSGYTQSAQVIDVRTALNFLNMGSNVDNTDSDKVILMVKMLAAGSNASSVVASMNIIEAL